MKSISEKLKSLEVIFDKISPKILVPMEYEHKGEEIEIEIETNEFSCICPWSKLPDFANLKIKYIPNKFCIELKSLKYYLHSYRNVGIVHESAVNKIFNDLKKCIKPKKLCVELEYYIRGGLKTTVRKHN